MFSPTGSKETNFARVVGFHTCQTLITHLQKAIGNFRIACFDCLLSVRPCSPEDKSPTLRAEASKSALRKDFKSAVKWMIHPCTCSKVIDCVPLSEIYCTYHHRLNKYCRPGRLPLLVRPPGTVSRTRSAI